MVPLLSGESRCVAICLVLFSGVAPSLHAQASSTSELNSRLETVARASDILKKLGDLQRESKQKLDASNFLAGYSLINRGNPGRSKHIARLYALFPGAKLDQGVTDILAADEKELERTPNPQEKEPSLDSAAILLLRERTSIRNTDGKVIDLNAFTLVRRLSIQGDTFTVTADGVNAFDVPKDKLYTGRGTVLAVAKQKQEEAAQLSNLAFNLATNTLNVVAQEKQRREAEERQSVMQRQVIEQQAAEQQQQAGQTQTQQKQTIDRQEEILFLLGKAHRPGMSVVLPPPKQQAEL
jgi:hypothetical protein